MTTPDQPDILLYEWRQLPADLRFRLERAAPRLTAQISDLCNQVEREIREEFKRRKRELLLRDVDRLRRAGAHVPVWMLEEVG